MKRLLPLALASCLAVQAITYSITISWVHSPSWDGTGEYILKQSNGTNGLFVPVATTTGTNVTVFVSAGVIRWHVTYTNRLGESGPSKELSFPPLFDVSPYLPLTPVVIAP
jgi:hypothetical protein